MKDGSSRTTSILELLAVKNIGVACEILATSELMSTFTRIFIKKKLLVTFFRIWHSENSAIDFFLNTDIKMI